MDDPALHSTGAESSATRLPKGENELSQLFNLSPDLLCIAGLDGYFKRVNPAWTRVLGWSEEELLSRPVEAFMHPEDRERTLQARAGLGRGVPVQGLENRYLCKDGSHRWLSWQSITAPGGLTVFCVARDITNRRRLDQEQLVRSKLESAGILAGGLAHDFNNLLTSVLLNLDMCRHCGPLALAQERHVQEARRAVLAAKSLTDQLLTLSTGGVSRREVSELPKLLQAAMEQAMEGADLASTLTIAQDLWPVAIDAARITHAVRSVIVNAREATPAGGEVTLQADNASLATPLLPGGPTGDFVRLQIIDTGVGIAPDVLPKVFDAYFSTKRRGAEKGVGLGLTMCRIALEEHGGRITIESRVHQGTKVTCLLPAWREASRGATGEA